MAVVSHSARITLRRLSNRFRQASSFADAATFFPFSLYLSHYGISTVQNTSCMSGEFQVFFHVRGDSECLDAAINACRYEVIGVRDGEMISMNHEVHWGAWSSYPLSSIVYSSIHRIIWILNELMIIFQASSMHEWTSNHCMYFPEKDTKLPSR